MKQIFSIALLFCICISVFAEDLIITKQGVKISAKIIEVNLTEIRYKKADNLEGPTYTMEKNKINTILYKNGSVGIFNEELDRNQYNTSRRDMPQIYCYGKTIYCDGNIIQPDEYLRLAKQFSPISFNYYVKGRRLMNAGWCLLSVGLAFEFIGSMVLCLSYNDGLGASLALLNIGNASVITSIPLLCVGARKKRESINNFGCGVGRPYGMGLNFGITSNGGLGLAFQF